MRATVFFNDFRVFLMSLSAMRSSGSRRGLDVNRVRYWIAESASRSSSSMGLGFGGMTTVTGCTTCTGSVMIMLLLVVGVEVGETAGTEVLVEDRLCLHQVLVSAVDVKLGLLVLLLETTHVLLQILVLHVENRHRHSQDLRPVFFDEASNLHDLQ